MDASSKSSLGTQWSHTAANTRPTAGSEGPQKTLPQFHLSEETLNQSQAETPNPNISFDLPGLPAQWLEWV